MISSIVPPLIRTPSHRGARGFLLGLALVLAACGGGDGSERPDANEMRRRVPLVIDALGLTGGDGGDPSTLTCILDENYGNLGYQLGYEGTSVKVSVAAAVTTCSTNEFDELPQAIATLHQVDVATVRPLVDTAVAAVAP